MKEAEIYLEEVKSIPLMSAQEIHTLLLRSAAGDEAAQLELVHANLRLVVECARKYVGRGAPFSDLIQEGNIGLMKAVKKFSTKGSTTFVEYARECIEKAIVHELREMTYEKEVELPPDETVENLTLTDLVTDGEISFERLNRLELMENLRTALDMLTAQEKKVLALRYGLGNGQAYSREEVAEIFKVNPDNLREVETAALKKLSLSERLREFL
jgi:RNA polymerase sigma factor (sigma-70 family)